jgi:hypothetical protein
VDSLSFDLVTVILYIALLKKEFKNINSYH